jgi:hypothetical protein
MSEQAMPYPTHKIMQPMLGGDKNITQTRSSLPHPPVSPVLQKWAGWVLLVAGSSSEPQTAGPPAHANNGMQAASLHPHKRSFNTLAIPHIVGPPIYKHCEWLSPSISMLVIPGAYHSSSLHLGDSRGLTPGLDACFGAMRGSKQVDYCCWCWQFLA